MARKSGSTISQEELYPPSDEPSREELDDARLVDLDVEQESPFLRAQKRVSVRRSSLPKNTATHLTWGVLALLVIAFFGFTIAALYHYGEHSWRFRVESSDDIEINPLHNVTRSQVIEVMGEDIGRNIFFVPLSERQKALEKIPWVESASVMRFVPNRLKIEIQERVPVAFARIGSRIYLMDTAGTLMDLPVTGKQKYSFPVILGMNLSEPASTRAARMKLYSDLVGQLDSGGARHSQDLSEVDLSDPDDVKVLANDPGGEVLVHLGSSSYLERYNIFVSHVQEWRQQFNKLQSVDLRYDRQIIVNPDLHGEVNPPLSLSAAKAAVAAGVKPAALVTQEVVTQKSSPKTPAKLASKPTAQISPKLPAQITDSKSATVMPAQKPAGKPAAKPGVKPVSKKSARSRRHRAILKKAGTREKIASAPAHNGSANSAATTKATSPAVQPSATQKPNSTPPATLGSSAAKPGGKPSPAIPRGQENP
jgi:cell division protein FtsQ